MSWASGKRFFILGIIGIVILIALGVIGYFVFHKAPSCTDGKQNQEEDGIDCGGSCTYLCTASELTPSVSFARAVKSGSRVDVVAVVANRNQNAFARDVHYTVKVYSPAPELEPLGSLSGTLDLPPGESVPLFIQGVYTGTKTVDQAFVEIDEESILWVKSPGARTPPTGSFAGFAGTPSAPRILGTVSNPSVRNLRNVPVIVVVRDVQDTVIAASQTIIPTLPAKGTATATFTWNMPFSSTPGQIDILPVLAL